MDFPREGRMKWIYSGFSQRREDVVFCIYIFLCFASIPSEMAFSEPSLFFSDPDPLHTFLSPHLPQLSTKCCQHINELIQQPKLNQSPKFSARKQHDTVSNISPKRQLTLFRSPPPSPNPNTNSLLWQSVSAPNPNTNSIPPMKFPSLRKLNLLYKNTKI